MNGRIPLAMMAILAVGQVRADPVPVGREIAASLDGRSAGNVLMPRAGGSFGFLRGSAVGPLVGLTTSIPRTLPSAAPPTGVGPTVPPPSDQVCRKAVAAAERAHNIPDHLLAGIARVESGRLDPTSGTSSPWPWTINSDGQGSFYDTKMQAVAAATALRQNVARSIDVGCMQISLVYHPDAFASLEQAFDPFANADYGARFLVQLYEKTGSWPKAVEWYHSATPDLGRDYGVKVYAALPEEAKLAAVATPAPVAAAWGAKPGRPMSAIPAFGQNSARMLPRVTGLGGEVAPGRTLDAYRAHPVRVAFRLR